MITRAILDGVVMVRVIEQTTDWIKAVDIYGGAVRVPERFIVVHFNDGREEKVKPGRVRFMTYQHEHGTQKYTYPNGGSYGIRD